MRHKNGLVITNFYALYTLSSVKGLIRNCKEISKVFYHICLMIIKEILMITLPYLDMYLYVYLRCKKLTRLETLVSYKKEMSPPLFVGKCTLSIGVTKTRNREKYALLQKFCFCFFRLLSLRKFERWYAKKI